MSTETIPTPTTTENPAGDAAAATVAEKKPIVRSFNFEDVKLSDIAKSTCIKCSPTTTVSEALNTMKKYRISAIPVYNKKEKKYIGTIDYFAIMAYVAFGSFKQQLIKDELSQINFEKLAIGDLMSLSKETSFLWEYDGSKSLESILEPLCKGVHRVAVKKVKGDHSKRKIISQRDVVHYLFKWAAAQKSCGKYIEFLDATLEDLNLTKNGSPVASVLESTPALEAFQKIYCQEVQAVAITDEKGEIVGELSVSDLRNLDQNKKLPAIFLPTRVFLHELNVKKDTYAITLDPKDTLFTTMEKLVRFNRKRAWVVGKDRVPQGVVTLSDIISKFSPY